MGSLIHPDARRHQHAADLAQVLDAAATYGLLRGMGQPGQVLAAHADAVCDTLRTARDRARPGTYYWDAFDTVLTDWLQVRDGLYARAEGGTT